MHEAQVGSGADRADRTWSVLARRLVEPPGRARRPPRGRAGARVGRRPTIAGAAGLAIGAEHGFQPLAECSVVVAPYEVEGEIAGTIGVLGPTRMNYPQALAAVAIVSQRLGRRLSEG